METPLRQMLGCVHPRAITARRVLLCTHLTDEEAEVPRGKFAFLRPHNLRGQSWGLDPLLPAHQHRLVMVFGAVCAPWLSLSPCPRPSPAPPAAAPTSQVRSASTWQVLGRADVSLEGMNRPGEVSLREALSLDTGMKRTPQGGNSNQTTDR